MNIEKLSPSYKSIIWGGDRLKNKFGKKTDLSPLAESWELSFHTDGKCKLADGTFLSDAVSEEDLGKNCQGFDFFPTLTKFIDANDRLSIQVHPSDEYALKNESSLGKTEMWYIVDAEEGAGIYLGFNKDITSDEFERAIKEHTLTDHLQFIPVKAGESYFIPSGTIHAICEGCLIYEIQQNSNITYRVYDYGRRGADGNERQLHVEQAIAVTDRKKYTEKHIDASTQDGRLLGMSKFFTATEIKSKEITVLPNDADSFRCITCIDGDGLVNGIELCKGESIFIPAGYGDLQLSGAFTAILTSIRRYYVGIDIGGTFIKGGIVNDRGEIITSQKIPTEAHRSAEEVTANIASLALELLDKCNLKTSDVMGIGIGCPGTIDSKSGNVIYSNNIGWSDFNIASAISKALGGIKVKVTNDANAAALGEVKFGAAKNYENAVTITLGTGVGSGIVVNGKLMEGNKGAGAELGHTVIHRDGEPCTCGRRGCLEAYCSATALIRDTKRVMLDHPNSKLWEVGDAERVTGKTPFDFAENDMYAKEIVREYIENLACGLTNFANVFRPEVILLGGGVCAQGDRLIKPLQKKIDDELFGKDKGPSVPILIAELGNNAGILGAAALIMD